jgi:hypothetical protein
MQALMERFPLGRPAVDLVFDLRIGDLTADDRALILSVTPPPRSDRTGTA